LRPPIPKRAHSVAGRRCGALYRRRGKRVAALNPISGADKILRLLEGIARKDNRLATLAARPAIVNGVARLPLVVALRWPSF
jgi:hypothetical protein